jgi:hypothetical protein
VKKSLILIISALFIGFLFGWFLNQNMNSTELSPNTSISNISKEKTQLIDSLESNYDLCEDIISLDPLIVKYGENEIFYCDEESGTLETNYCSGVRYCIEKQRFDSINTALITLLDSLILAQKKEMNLQSSNIELIDYQSIKD